MRFPRRRQPFQQQRFEPFFVLEGEGDRQRAGVSGKLFRFVVAVKPREILFRRHQHQTRALPVTLAFEDEERFKSLLLERLAAARKTIDGRGR